MDIKVAQLKCFTWITAINSFPNTSAVGYHLGTSYVWGTGPFTPTESAYGCSFI